MVLPSVVDAVKEISAVVVAMGDPVGLGLGLELLIPSTLLFGS